MVPRLIICTCTHKDGQHAQDGPCTGQDSYGQPCECPGLEPDQYSSGEDTPDDSEDHHWGPELGGHRPPEGVGESKSPA
jgi:hypothetical protein